MNPIYSEVDLDDDGNHHGFLRIPHSVHRSAYGFIPVPIVSIKNGPRPVVLFLAGNHGDEYEGQVALGNLIRRLNHKEIQGQLIILTMANYPAAKAGLRTSPIDQGNLNRSFPGNPNGNPTEIMAHYIESVLLEKADFMLDIHSGGSSLLYKPTLLMPTGSDNDSRRQRKELVDCFNFPTNVFYPDQIDAHYSSSAALRKNVVGITAEMAGAGMVNHDAVTVLESAIDRYLHYVGIMKTPGPTIDIPLAATYEIPSRDYYIFANGEGVFEPVSEIGDQVNQGDILGYVHHPETPWLSPDLVLSTATGQIICKRVPARVQHGDCLFEMARPLSLSLDN